MDAEGESSAAGWAGMSSLAEASACLREHDFEGALSRLRSEIDAGRPSPEVTRLIERLVALTGGRARAADFGLPLGPENRAPMVFIACMPKSGSTFLSHLLAEVLGAGHRYGFYEAHQNEQDIHGPALIEAARSPAVIQQHVRATERNVQILQALDVRPVVLIRDVFDAMVSMRDMIDSGGTESVFFPVERLPGRTHTIWADLDEDTRTRATVMQYGFWYVEFYASWRRALAAGRLDALLLEYSEVMANKRDAVTRILEHAGLSAPLDGIDAALERLEVDPTRTRKNVGKKGRGQTIPEELRTWIRGHTTYFPQVDFAPVGLG